MVDWQITLNLTGFVVRIKEKRLEFENGLVLDRLVGMYCRVRTRTMSLFEFGKADVVGSWNVLNQKGSSQRFLRCY